MLFSYFEIRYNFQTNHKLVKCMYILVFIGINAKFDTHCMFVATTYTWLVIFELTEIIHECLFRDVKKSSGVSMDITRLQDCCYF